MSFNFHLSGHVEAALEEARTIETDIYRRVKAFVHELEQDYAAHVHGAQWSGQHTGPVDIHAATTLSPPESQPSAVAPPGGETPSSPPEPPGAAASGSPAGGEDSSPPASEPSPPSPGTADAGGSPTDPAAA